MNSTSDSFSLFSPTPHDFIVHLITIINFYSMLFGIFSNLVCICVFVQKTLLKKKINFYLLILAMIDFVFCIILSIHYFLLKRMSITLYDFSLISCYMTDYVVSTIDTFGVYLTLVMSVDRFYAITRPIKSKNFFTSRFAKRIILSGYFALLLIKLPDLLFNQREYIRNAKSESDDQILAKLIHLYNNASNTSSNRKREHDYDSDLLISLSNYFLFKTYILVQKSSSSVPSSANTEFLPYFSRFQNYLALKIGKSRRSKAIIEK
jgi:predicted transposase